MRRGTSFPSILSSWASHAPGCPAEDPFLPRRFGVPFRMGPLFLALLPGLSSYTLTYQEGGTFQVDRW